MRLWSLAVMCCGALAFPASALAVNCAPPGNSGVDQYFETVPGASCNGSSSGSTGGGSGSGGHGSHLSAATRRQLAAQGAAGQAVARLASSSGTSSSPPASHHGSAGGGTAGRGVATGPNPPSSSGRGLLSALLHPILSGSRAGGTGILLPLFLAAALVLALVGTLVRRRRLHS